MKNPVIVILIVIPCFNYCRRTRCWGRACFTFFLPLSAGVSFKALFYFLMQRGCWCFCCFSSPCCSTVHVCLLFGFSEENEYFRSDLCSICLCSNTICHCKKLWRLYLSSLWKNFWSSDRHVVAVRSNMATKTATRGAVLHGATMYLLGNHWIKVFFVGAIAFSATFLF